MSVLKHRLTLMIAMVALMVGQVWAGPEEDLKRYVDENTQKLVQKLNAEKGLYEKDPEAFYASMDETLQEFVDFRRIAARVMGRYARQTTPEQRDAFVEKFKRSLFDSYAQALVSAEDFEIIVKEATILPQNEDRASVEMELISASGNRYPVTYSMYRTGDDRWMMENVIVEGVNIGLAFRDRFAQEMEENRGQVQAVIDGWGDAVEALNLDEQVDRS
ncbi:MULTISPECIES: MlaC/ttg2D family ABC transporter substrate-binding protein [Marinobacter]|jgi:phospholipid transport system substrate-binding protein|uniref:ABC transporter substrate-binding protein n=1 Tax=Marinobacter nauticus TaxID=2743 RepID=A0A3B8WWE7_MARNT|nr:MULTISPECIES: ABC transporter substrate-binding protein [Marinobacter]MCG8523374.1 ABC transporter substrate-binding protein [Pseudomonadales bacterium]MEC9084029.1 ABC transporter substrate-binding protein [Pseudomonadota bacterium]ERS09660.1 toluene tolerance protein [Marinobacter sp. EN3]KAE8544885.1 Phospholipid ABC transporter shuttle protein MlaC [Marinobacter nauticus]MAL33950.1 toluene tolerance protein [Marinobacter sp.]|tara:strand:- start:1397 stop:2050 length:654 start_codon:yes stop_codon:yes gene_type:complete